MDLLDVKSRIAQALVESVFRRARYQVSRCRADPLRPRIGHEDFSPDLRVCLKQEDGDTCELLVEVKYRPHLDQFILVENERGDRSVFLMARRQWPQLYLVLVTDHPEPGRSCFQAISFGDYVPGERFRTVDLVNLKELRIFPQNVEDHEELVHRIFGHLTGA